MEFESFLAAGSITFPAVVADPDDVSHIFGVSLTLSACHNLVSPDEEPLVRALSFLVDHEFVAVQCFLWRGRLQSTGSTGLTCALIIRVYIIPYDLPNVQGRLRRREPKVLTTAKTQFRQILPRMTRDKASWDGRIREASFDLPVSEPFLPPETDDRTMAELYSSLDSPNVSLCPIDLDALTQENGRLVGMRSKLYPYQHRSVRAMLCKELGSTTVPDPLYIPLHSIDGTQTFYFQPATLEVLSECPTVMLSRGGILCEELGTGKTVMVLALVLSTLDHLPTPEVSLANDQTVHTPLSFHTFPHPEAVHFRLQHSKRAATQASSPRIPSLREHLIHYFRVNPDELDYRSHSDTLADRGFALAIEKNVPFYFAHQEDPIPNPTQRSRRQKVDKRPRVTYLSAATLVVVPANLLNQWENEIHKHCEDSLRVYVAKNGPLESAMKLATDYDIILMSHSRFSAEESKDKVPKLHNWKPCNCAPIDPQLRVPNCKSNCQDFQDVSPLLQVRWKRLVLDEGHVSANFSGNLTSFAKLLSVERRWVVTGTPTTNLMGLKFGDGSELLYPEDEELQEEDTSSQIPSTPSVNATDIDVAEDEISTISSSSSSSSQPISRGRLWTTHDKNDLNKLAGMITHFLKAEPFTSSIKLFSTHVVVSLMDKEGPRPGSIKVLTQVMQAMMIRHQSEDVEQDVLLPIMGRETVLLDLEPYAVRTYNILQAGIVINAVDSERKDQDYLFHPMNHAHLLQIIENISQAMFWHTDDGLFSIHDQYERRQSFLEKAAKREVPAGDMIMLEQALTHVEEAVNDHVWQALCEHICLPHEIVGLSSSIYDAWSVLPETIKEIVDFPSRPSKPPHFLCVPERLTKMRQMLYHSPFASTSTIIGWGDLVKEEQELVMKFSMEKLRVSRVYKKQVQKVSRKSNSRSSTDQVFLKESSVRDPGKLKEVHSELLRAQAQVKALHSTTTDPDHQQGRNNTRDLNPARSHSNAGGGVGTSLATSNASDRMEMLASSPLANVRVGNSTSSKMNFILKELMTFASTDKFLIFSKSPLTLAYIAEALELFQIKFLQFTTKVPLREREQYVTTFESSDLYRIFLMELKHGARGLNLITATRIIFCEPVWQADVETQAIKRVHRIGQTRPVTVKTLAIRSTFEEFMLSHRQERNTSTGRKSGTFADDRTMRDYIANPSFLPIPPPGSLSSNPTIDFPLLPNLPRRLSENGEPLPPKPRFAKKPRLVQFE